MDARFPFQFGEDVALDLSIRSYLSCYGHRDFLLVSARFKPISIGVHGAGGTIGALLTGVFATRSVNAVFRDPQGSASG